MNRIGIGFLHGPMDPDLIPATFGLSPKAPPCGEQSYRRAKALETLTVAEFERSLHLPQAAASLKPQRAPLAGLITLGKTKTAAYATV